MFVEKMLNCFSKRIERMKWIQTVAIMSAIVFCFATSVDAKHHMRTRVKASGFVATVPSQQIGAPMPSPAQIANTPPEVRIQVNAVPSWQPTLREQNSCSHSSCRIQFRQRSK